MVQRLVVQKNARFASHVHVEMVVCVTRVGPHTNAIVPRVLVEKTAVKVRIKLTIF